MAKLGKQKKVVKKTSSGYSVTKVNDLTRRQLSNRKNARAYATKVKRMDYKLQTAQTRAGVQKSGVRAAAVTGTGSTAISQSEETERSKQRTREPLYKDNENKIKDQANGGIGGGGGSAIDDDSDFA